MHIPFLKYNVFPLAKSILASTPFVPVTLIVPSELIEKYGLKKPIYFDMCKNGMFENDEYAWNKG